MTSSLAPPAVGDTAALPASKPIPASWVGIPVRFNEQEHGHVTLTWCGRLSSAEVDMLHVEVTQLTTQLNAISKGQGVTFTFDDWEVMGKEADVKAGKGFDVRICHIEDKEVNQVLQAFHRKWYHASPGDAAERALQQRFHVTVHKEVPEFPKPILTRATVIAASAVTCSADSIFVSPVRVAS